MQPRPPRAGDRPQSAVRRDRAACRGCGRCEGTPLVPIRGRRRSAFPVVAHSHDQGVITRAVYTQAPDDFTGRTNLDRRRLDGDPFRHLERNGAIECRRLTYQRLHKNRFSDLEWSDVESQLELRHDQQDRHQHDQQRHQRQTHESERVTKDLSLQAQDDTDLVLKQPHADQVAADAVADLADPLLVGGLAEEPHEEDARGERDDPKRPDRRQRAERPADDVEDPRQHAIDQVDERAHQSMVPRRQETGNSSQKESGGVAVMIS